MRREREDKILYLSSKETEHLCSKLDSVAIMRDVFRLHASSQTLLPDEAYLGWTNSSGETVRSLNMPGYLGDSFHVAGTKIINGNIANPQRGLPRASGVTLLYDDTTVRIQCIMDSAYISSLRTASVTALATELCQGPEIHTLAVIGAGELAYAHITLLIKHFPSVRNLVLFDLDDARTGALEARVSTLLSTYEVTVQRATSARDAIRDAQLIVPVTTTTEGYIQFDWLQPGAILVNVSLDDVLPEVVFRAQKVFVDDWSLVKSDSRRLLGRLYRSGQISGPGELKPAQGRSIDAQLGEIVLKTSIGRDTMDDIILINPFGMAIEDIALAAHVYQAALDQQAGIWLDR